MAIWVPPSAHQEAMHARREYQRDIELVAEKRGSVEEWDKVLAEIDPHLSIFFAPDWTNVPGITPGRFHLLLNPPDGIPSVMPLVGAVGEYVEPNSGMLEKLRESDMWNQAAGRERAKKEKALEQAKQRAKQREDEERQDEIRDRLKAVVNPGVSFAKTGSWSARAGARKRAA